MGKPINAPLTSDIWHLSIDDLLAPLPESPRLGGPGPFVINLSASTAPISPRALPHCASARVYQIQRIEDRRLRYRLRLGPFQTEEQADAQLAIVRDIYPSALTATAESDDLRAIEALEAKAEARRLSAARAERAGRAAATQAAERNAEIPVLGATPAAERNAEIPVLGATSAAHDPELPTGPSPAWVAFTAGPPSAPAAIPQAADVPVLCDSVDVDWRENSRPSLPAVAVAPAAGITGSPLARPARERRSTDKGK